MKSQLRFAVIGFSSLESIAIRRILSDDVGVLSDSFRTAEEFLPRAERYDAFIVTPEVALFYPDFFLTRKQRLAVATSSRLVSDSQPLSFSTDSDEERIVESFRRLAASVNEETPVQGELSSREIDVLREVASGKTNKEIADSLCISINTVITHRRNLSSKLGIRSASGLSLYAVMNGIV